MDYVLTSPITIFMYYTVCEKTERKKTMAISKVVLVLLLAGVADGETNYDCATYLIMGYMLVCVYPTIMVAVCCICTNTCNP